MTLQVANKLNIKSIGNYHQHKHTATIIKLCTWKMFILDNHLSYYHIRNTTKSKFCNGFDKSQLPCTLQQSTFSPLQDT